MSLVGTAEVPLTAYHNDEILAEADLPVITSYSIHYTKLYEPEQRSGCDKRTSVEEIAPLAAHDLCCLIPGIRRQPEALSIFDDDRFAVSSFLRCHSRHNA